MAKPKAATAEERITALEESLAKLTERFNTHGNHGHVEAEVEAEPKEKEDNEDGR